MSNTDIERAQELDSSRDEAAPQQAAQAVQGSPRRSSDAHLSPSKTPSARRGSIQGASTTTAQPRLQPNFQSDRGATDLSIEKGTNVVHLQPVDEGFGAWSYVAGAFAMYIVVWGFPQAYPIIGTYLTVGDAAKYPGSITLSLLAPGIQDIIEGLLFQMLPTSHRARRPLIFLGIGIILFSLLWASWASTSWEVFVSLGISFGIGGIILNFVHVSVFSEWFDKKRGQAMGIVWLGYRFGALGLPLICQYLLEMHGYEKTIQVLIAPALALLVPSILLLRGRFPSSSVQSNPVEPTVSKRTAIRAPSVLFHLLAGTLFYAVVTVPKMFIMAYAADMGLKASEQVYAFVILIMSTMVGTYVLGWLSDLIAFEGLVCLAALATSASHLFIWGFARQKLVLYIYALLVGLSIGGKY